MNPRIYLDHNATSPLRPEVRDAVVAGMDRFGNPSSVHREGRRARAAVEAAREQVAALVGARAQDVVFTSGATEANNLAVSQGFIVASARERATTEHTLVSAIEHPCVLEAGLARNAKLLPVTADGVVDVARAVAEIARASRPLVAVMAANNETGVIQPIGPLAEATKAAGGALLADCVAYAGRKSIALGDWGPDAIALSAHKIGGPMGVGALVMAGDRARLAGPMIRGGRQEHRLRAGTENVPAIIGFGVAAERARAEISGTAPWAGLRSQLEQGLKAVAGDTVIFGEAAERLDTTIAFAVPGTTAETLLIALDLDGIAASSGSACSSGKVSRSHVLDAMGIADDLARAALRLSLGWSSSAGDVAALLAAWQRILPKQRSLAGHIKAA